MNITFYYVRHGQTRFNKAQRLQGWCDAPLTKQGEADAQRAGQALKNIAFDRAYSSSSGRARDTMEIVLNGRALPGRALKDLREFDYGDLDGMLIKDAMDEIRNRQKSYDFKDLDGDDMASFIERSRRAFDTIVNESKDGDKVLVVSHGSFGRLILEPMFGIDPNPNHAEKDTDGIWLPNGGIMKFAYTDEGWKMLTLPCSPEEFND